jgi:hypothetical protein
MTSASLGYLDVFLRLGAAAFVVSAVRRLKARVS